MKQCECSVTGAFRERHVGKLMPWIFGNYELHIAENMVLPSNSQTDSIRLVNSSWQSRQTVCT